MRLDKAAKAFPHAKFHSLSTGYTQATVKHPPSVMIWGLCSVIAQLAFSFYQPEQQRTASGIAKCWRTSLKFT